MFTDKKRYGQTPDVVIRSAAATFNAPLKWAKNREKYGHVNRVFVDSWSDFFIEEADAWRAEAWAIIRQTPNLTYQLCTKRPERIAACLPADWGQGYPNVWLMVTAENQPMADLRVPILLRIPAVVHGVSVEPMVGAVRLDRIGEEPEGYLNALAAVVHCDGRGTKSITGLDWVICGGESGPCARPMNQAWARSLRDQCKATGTPFFFKQWGEFAPIDSPIGNKNDVIRGQRQLVQLDGTHFNKLFFENVPAGAQWMERQGKEAAGALLDGREWKEFPAVTA
jgi:protein gp37